MRTGTAHLPLHRGKAPRWLFLRMVRLARAITITMVESFGPEQYIHSLANPFWFQAFGCILGFDWHSSGLTTTVCGAIKEGIAGIEDELHLYPCGGKGKRSRNTPTEIAQFCNNLEIDPSQLIYNSRLSAKVDNTAVQDGYQLYHHFFIFTQKQHWSVIQQGMNPQNHYARRYHWHAQTQLDFVSDPHAGIASEATHARVLNMAARESKSAQESCQTLSCTDPDKWLIKPLSLFNYEAPKRHYITSADINPKYIRQTLLRTYEAQPKSFEALLGLPGVGPKTIRALALTAQLIFGTEPSFKDPARYSFAHGGKDGHPYHVNRTTYEETISFLEKSINRAHVERTDKVKAFRRLATLVASLQI